MDKEGGHLANSFSINFEKSKGVSLNLDNINHPLCKLWRYTAHKSQTNLAMQAGIFLPIFSLLASIKYNVREGNGRISPLSLSCFCIGDSTAGKSYAYNMLYQKLEDLSIKKANEILIANKKIRESGSTLPLHEECQLLETRFTIEGLCGKLGKQGALCVSSDDAGEVLFGHSLRDISRTISTLAIFNDLHDGIFTPCINQKRSTNF